jgi:hypothetical protein
MPLRRSSVWVVTVSTKAPHRRSPSTTRAVIACGATGRTRTHRRSLRHAQHATRRRHSPTPLTGAKAAVRTATPISTQRPAKPSARAKRATLRATRSCQRRLCSGRATRSARTVTAHTTSRSPSRRRARHATRTCTLSRNRKCQSIGNARAATTPTTFAAVQSSPAPAAMRAYTLITRNHLRCRAARGRASVATIRTPRRGDKTLRKRARPVIPQQDPKPRFTPRRLA